MSEREKRGKEREEAEGTSDIYFSYSSVNTLGGGGLEGEAMEERVTARLSLVPKRGREIGIPVCI